MPETEDAPKGRKAPPKQLRLPKMQPEHIVEIDEAIEQYNGVLDERMRLTKEEVKLHDKVLDLIRQNKCPGGQYRHGNYWFVIDRGKDKVKRKRVQDEDDGDKKGKKTDGE